MPTVSVIIPTYNRATLLKRSIESVLNQTLYDLELIVVDDGSIDNTKDIVNSISDSRLQYIQLRENTGASTARNIGIENSCGKYIAFQDSDDEWKPEKLEKQIRLAESEGVDFVFCSLVRVKSNGQVVGRVPDFTPPANEAQFIEALLIKNFAWTQTWLIRASAIKGKYSFDADIVRIQDWDLVLKIVSNLNYRYIDEPLVTAYVTDGSLLSLESERGQDLKIMLNTHAELLRRYPKVLSGYYQAIAIACRENSCSSYLEGCYWSLKSLQLRPFYYRCWFTLALAFMGPFSTYVLQLVRPQKMGAS